MNNLNDYINLPYKLEIIPDPYEGGFVASFPDLPGCLSSGQTIQTAIENAQNAKIQWLEAALEDKIEIPLPRIESNYSGQFKLRLPKTLHKQLAEASKEEGISMNQFCIYLLSMNFAKHVASK